VQHSELIIAGMTVVYQRIALVHLPLTRQHCSWPFTRGLRETLHPRLNSFVRYAAVARVMQSALTRQHCSWPSTRGFRETLHPRQNAFVRYAAVNLKR